MSAGLLCGVNSRRYNAALAAVKDFLSRRKMGPLRAILGTMTETRKSQMSFTPARIQRATALMTRYPKTEHGSWPAGVVSERAPGGGNLDTQISVLCHLG